MRLILSLFFALVTISYCQSQPTNAASSNSKRGGGIAGGLINTVAPVISGTSNLGDVLTTTNGTWNVTPDSYTYTWQRSSVNISGATSSTYTLNYLDENALITCKVIATKGAITSVPSTSNSISVFSMIAVSNIQGWWDVNNANNTLAGSVMQSVKDKTANVRHMSSTDGGGYPTYTSSGGLNNTGYITIGSKSIFTPDFVSTIAQPLTVYFVYKNNSLVDGKKIYQYLGSNGWVSQNNTTSGIAIQYHAGSTYNNSLTNGANTNWQLMVNHIDNVSSYIQINNEPYRQNGYTNQGQAGTNGMGYFGFQPTGSMADINFSEAIVVSGTVSTTTDANIRLYLTQKYGLVNNKFAVYFGDSITTGAIATDINAESYVTVLSHNKGYDYVSIAYPGSVAVPTASHAGVAGENLADTYTRAFVVKDNYVAEGYYFFAYGTNDQSPDASWKASYKAIVQTFITKGVPLSHIIMVGVPYHSSTPLATPYIIAIASELGVSYYDNQAHMVANGGATLMNADGLHPNTAGHADMASGLAIYLP